MVIIDGRLMEITPIKFADSYFKVGIESPRTKFAYMWIKLHTEDGKPDHNHVVWVKVWYAQRVAKLECMELGTFLRVYANVDSFISKSGIFISVITGFHIEELQVAGDKVFCKERSFGIERDKHPRKIAYYSKRKLKRKKILNTETSTTNEQTDEFNPIDEEFIE